MPSDRELTEAELQQRRDAARARWRDRAAQGAAGAAAAVTVATGLNAGRRYLAGQALQQAKAEAAAARDRGERNVARHQAAVSRIERQTKSDWPLPAWRRHLGRQSRLFENEVRNTPDWARDEVWTAARRAERMRLDNRMQAARTPRPLRDIGRAGGGFFVAGQKKTKKGKKTVIPQRLQGDLDARLAEGWVEPRSRSARQALAFPTGADLKQIREEVREGLPLRHQVFADATRSQARERAGQAAAAGVRQAQRFLRRIPKIGRGAMFAVAAGGALAGASLAKIAPAELDRIARRAAPPSSSAQAEAGTYRKGHVSLHGLRIAIETPRGGERLGWTKEGRIKWRCRMPAHYGYVKGSLGADGDEVDVYLGPAAHDPECPVFVVDQHRLDGTFDEHKAILGARSEREALRIYDGGFSDGSGPRRRRAVTAMTVEEFRSKALNGRMGKPLAKAAPIDAPDDGAWPRDVEPDYEAASYPEPPSTAAAEQSLARRLAALFRSWLEQPRRLGDETALDAALRGPLERAMLAGASAAQIPPDAGGGLAGVRDPDRILSWSFDYRNPEVQRRLEQYSLARIRAISAESRDAIRAAVIAGARMGLPVEEQARRIRESIGLSPGQMDWVTSYRAQLETLDPRALGRALRDRRHDGPISRAIANQTPLSAEDIDRYVASYHRRALAYRATTIARTEALRGANTGMVETARVALQQMPDMTVEKVWIATKDSRTRDAHRALDGMVVQGLDTAFVYRDPVTGQVENLRWPHDDQAAAHQVVNCRCTFGLRLVPKPGAGRFIAEAA